MQLTHEEAIQLIEYKADKTMHGAQEKLLHEHLKDCTQCNAYASEFKEMENVLQRVMQKHWNQRPAPFSIRDLKAEKKLQKSTKYLSRIVAYSDTIDTVHCHNILFNALSGDLI